jgi:hypothetical protein
MLAGQASLPENAARRVSFSELLGSPLISHPVGVARESPTQ